MTEPRASTTCCVRTGTDRQQRHPVRWRPVEEPVLRRRLSGLRAAPEAGRRTVRRRPAAATRVSARSPMPTLACSSRVSVTCSTTGPINGCATRGARYSRLLIGTPSASSLSTGMAWRKSPQRAEPFAPAGCSNVLTPKVSVTISEADSTSLPTGSSIADYEPVVAETAQRLDEQHLCQVRARRLDRRDVEPAILELPEPRGGKAGCRHRYRHDGARDGRPNLGGAGSKIHLAVHVELVPVDRCRGRSGVQSSVVSPNIVRRASACHRGGVLEPGRLPARRVGIGIRRTASPARRCQAADACAHLGDVARVDGAVEPGHVAIGELRQATGDRRGCGPRAAWR